MPITVPHYNVTVARSDDIETAMDTGDVEEFKRVPILHADQVVAEQSGPRYGLGTDLRAAPMQYTTLWVWCALRRRGLEVVDFPLWKQRVIALDQDDADQDGDPVDPTTPGRGTGLL
jgi:hypothetical protein